MTMTAEKQQSLEAALTEAIAEAIEQGWTYTQIAEKSGVSIPQIQRFATGVRSGLKLQTVDKLIDHFGIRVGKPQRNIKRPPAN